MLIFGVVVEQLRQSQAEREWQKQCRDQKKNFRTDADGVRAASFPPPATVLLRFRFGFVKIDYRKLYCSWHICSVSRLFLFVGCGVLDRCFARTTRIGPKNRRPFFP